MHLSPSPAAEPPTTFATLPLSPAMLSNLQQLAYLQMTPIQAASLPLALAGNDLIAQAKTGSGKTAAFGLPLLAKLNPKQFAIQALVLCPTRELADQVTQEIRRLARFEENIKVLSLCGGSALRNQVTSLENGVHVVVGTPGRIMDHMERGSLKLDALTTLVLDEADRMLDMGFHDDIAYIAKRCPSTRQTLLFSATYPEGIAQLARQFLRQPQEVKLLEQHGESKIRQRFFEVKHEDRLAAVVTLLKHYRPVSTLAFCNTKQQCRDLVNVLRHAGIQALTLNGDLEQRERDQVLIQFANRSCSVLVATDVAARGLDISELAAVINVDVTPDPEIHIHRIGRTGRGDQEGWALSLCSHGDRRRVNAIAEAMACQLTWAELGTLDSSDSAPLVPPMSTLLMLGGRKDKIRPGDILGALTGEAGTADKFSADQIGKITITEQTSYIAVRRDIARAAIKKLEAGKVKGKTVKVRILPQ